MPLVRTFLAWKKGDERDDCQDSIHPPPDDTPADNSNALAVSDGATTSFFSRAWARILTSHFAEQTEKAFSNWERWLEGAQEKWKAEVGEIANSGKASFFVVNGFNSRKPAGATFAGFVLGEKNENNWPWRALVLGDSCIFILGADGSPRVMELQTSEDFTNLVRTAQSRPIENPHVPSKHESLPGGNEAQIEEHDTVLIASDALSKWMLRRLELKCPVWGSVLELDDDQKFQNLVAQARAEAENPLENDDVALALLKFGEPHSRYQQDRFDPKPAAPPAPVEKRDGTIASSVLLKKSLSDLSGEQPHPILPTALIKPRCRVRSFVGLLMLSVVSLLAVWWLAVSRNRALDLARILQDEIRQLSAEKNAASANAEQLRHKLRDAENERDQIRQEAAKNTAQFSREKAEQAKVLESSHAANQLKVDGLEKEIAALKEKLTKSVPPPVTADTPVLAPK